MTRDALQKLTPEDGKSVTGQRSNQTELRPHFVFLPLMETRVFTGFPQVQSFHSFNHDARYNDFAG